MTNLDEVLRLISQLSEEDQVEVACQINVCPFDCDGCHDEECICDRLGCAGNPLN